MTGLENAVVLGGETSEGSVLNAEDDGSAAYILQPFAFNGHTYSYDV